jgi:hypothetical protein
MGHSALRAIHRAFVSGVFALGHSFFVPAIVLAEQSESESESAAKSGCPTTLHKNPRLSTPGGGRVIEL